MPNNEPPGLSGLFNIQQLEVTALNVVENFCAIVTRPVEMITRPWHGSRYFTLPVIFFSNAMMIALPVLSILMTSMASMVPFVRVPPHSGFSASARLRSSTSCSRSFTGFASIA
jgi:hypothetical protein